jgi:hypothetical protein
VSFVIINFIIALIKRKEDKKTSKTIIFKQQSFLLLSKKDTSYAERLIAEVLLKEL